MPKKLGVNIDHIATLRQARRECEPSPILAARLCEEAGADSIVAHLREDRRHISDGDIYSLRKSVKTRFNMEMSIALKIVRIACDVRPDQATLVPERRQEITTEGGLDVVKNFFRVAKTVEALNKRKIEVSLFIDPLIEQIQASRKTGAATIELHTGSYALAKTRKQRAAELKKIKEAAHYAHGLGLVVNAGHGLNYSNARAVAQIPSISELNIGHSIVSRAVVVGLKRAVQEMLKIIR